MYFQRLGVASRCAGVEYPRTRGPSLLDRIDDAIFHFPPVLYLGANSYPMSRTRRSLPIHGSRKPGYCPADARRSAPLGSLAGWSACVEQDPMATTIDQLNPRSTAGSALEGNVP